MKIKTIKQNLLDGAGSIDYYGELPKNIKLVSTATYKDKFGENWIAITLLYE